MIEDGTPVILFFAGALRQEALDRVIAAPRSPIVIPLRHAHAVVAAIAGLAFRVVIEPSPAAKEALDRVRSTWTAFVQAASHLGRTADALPAPEMLGTIGEWVSNLPKRGAGAPAIQSEAMIYPILLSAYQHMYQQTPAGTLNGPTSRFIAAFNLEMTTALATIVRQENGVTVPSPKWPQPTSANLQKKIRTHRGDKGSDALVRDILRKIASQQT